MEEAAFIDPAMFFEVVVPLIGVANTAVIGITTPQSGVNYFTELMELKDAFGKSLFYVEQIGLVCSACKKTGENCKHNLDMNPPWKPPERMAKVDAIMATNPVLRDQETRGVTAAMDFAISAKSIESFKKRDRFEFPDGYPGVIFSAVDPSGGGSGSDYVVSTFACREGGIPVWIGTDATSSSDPLVIDEMLRDHYSQIREIPKYKNCMIRVYIEANMSFVTANQIANNLQTCPGLQGPLFKVVRFDPQDKGRFGIWTSSQSKEKWVLNLRRCIPIMSAVPDRDFVSELPVEKNIELLCEQLQRFRKIMAPHKGKPEQNMALFPKFTWNGKSGGKKDDRVAAACIAITCMLADCYDNDPLRDEIESMGLPLVCA